MNRRGFFQTIGFGAIAAAVAKALPTRKRPTQAKLDAMLAKLPPAPTHLRWAKRRDDGSLCACGVNGDLPENLEPIPLDELVAVLGDKKRMNDRFLADATWLRKNDRVWVGGEWVRLHRNHVAV